MTRALELIAVGRFVKSFFLVCLVIYLGMSVQSCSDNEPLPHLDYSRAIQLEKGNYWIYESTITDLFSGERLHSNSQDSIFIAKDTIIGNMVYFVVENMFGLNEIKRESSGTIVGIDGAVEFSATNFVDTLFKDPALDYYGIMAKEEDEITVPAGSFSTVSFILLRRNSPGHQNQADSNNPSVHDREFSILKKVWYARNVGVIKSADYYGNVTSSVRELKRYKVK